jgi:hypothetical protein
MAALEVEPVEMTAAELEEMLAAELEEMLAAELEEMLVAVSEDRLEEALTVEAEAAETLAVALEATVVDGARWVRSAELMSLYTMAASPLTLASYQYMDRPCDWSLKQSAMPPWCTSSL